MYRCKFRALDCAGEFQYFIAADVPVRTGLDEFILARRPGVKRLQISSICLTMDHLPLGEGDRVRVFGMECTVKYDRGFYFETEDTSRILSNIVTEVDEVIYTATTMQREWQFRYGDLAFPLAYIRGYVDGKVIVTQSQEPVDAELIQTGAGFRYKNKKLYYGGVVEGAELIMWHGRPCIQRGRNYIEIPSMSLIGGVS